VTKNWTRCAFCRNAVELEDLDPDAPNDDVCCVTCSTLFWKDQLKVEERAAEQRAIEQALSA